MAMKLTNTELNSVSGGANYYMSNYYYAVVEKVNNITGTQISRNGVFTSLEAAVNKAIEITSAIPQVSGNAAYYYVSFYDGKTWTNQTEKVEVFNML